MISGLARLCKVCEHGTDKRVELRQRARVHVVIVGLRDLDVVVEQPLLALSDGGKPSYDHNLAQRLSELGVPCFGCTPKLLVQVMERVMKSQDISGFIAAQK